MKLDSIDLRIIEAVRRNGRLTKQALAEKVGLSATPAWARLKKLESNGIITGYHARISPTLNNASMRVLVEVTLESHRHIDFQRFEKAVSTIPEVVSCWSVGGGVDYFLTTQTNDIDAYQRLIDRLLAMEIGIKRYFTYIITRDVKTQTD
ncbi:Lrp/AsnC family transcriptional regulator [Brucellaceae bacterium C25G]